MRTSPSSQREFKQYRVDELLADFDLEQIGLPTLSERDGWYYILDGQHRVGALRQFGFDDNQEIQCQVYTGMTEAEEAERFLKLNNTLTVAPFDKFRVAIQAGRHVEADIDRVVRAQGLKVSRDDSDGSISAVGTLRRVYVRSGPAVLGRGLRIVRDAYGTAGLTAAVIEGLCLLCQRYETALDDNLAVERLGGVRGGVNGLAGRAEVLRKQTGHPKGHCVAAAAVEIYNNGRRSGRLSDWWKED